LDSPDTPTARDRQVLEKRLQYLDSLRPSLTQEKLLGEWAKSREKVVERLIGKKAKQ
jgi:hypothetical protein